jgi:hypothetical protein
MKTTIPLSEKTKAMLKARKTKDANTYDKVLMKLIIEYKSKTKDL